MKAAILLVDDELSSLFAMEQLLARPDREIVAVKSGKEALRELLRNDFALILLDVRMPDMDGFEVATLARQIKRSRNTPIIFLTAALNDTRAMFRGYEIGVVDYIMKPVDPAVLQSKVDVFVGLHVRNVELSRQIVERRSAERELSRTNEDLETKIRERTTSLIKANELLRREISMRRLAEENLRKSEMQARKLATVASRTDNAVIIKDADNRIEWVNESFTRIYGYRLDEVRGQDAAALLGGHAAPQKEFPPGGTSPGGHGDKTEVIRYSRDGRKWWLMVESQPIIDDTGALTGYIEIETDITDRKQAEEDLHKAMQAAEAANQAKSEFLANMSHEIRTPMNAIIGMTELALQSELTAEQREYMTLVKASGETLLTVINDILDFSKIEAGRLEVETIPFSLRDCIGDTLKTLALDAHRKGLELACEIASDLPDALLGDPVRLRQVIVNLVGNAIKFTEHGEIVLRARVEDREGDDIRCYFTVSDSGVGIAEEKRASIFAPFLQADTSTTRLYGGTGLGLSISARLVEIMNGAIWVDSEPGCGSTFHFTLQFGLQANQPDRLRLDGAGRHVLIVDCHETSRSIIGNLLRAWNLEVHEVAGAEAALQRIARMERHGSGYVAALLDDSLPADQCQALAARIKGAQGVAVLLCATGRREDALAASGMAYLSKPVKQSELHELICETLGFPTGRASRHVLPASDGARRAATFDILLVEDNAVNRRLAQLVLEKEGHRVTAAENGSAALDVLAQKRFDLVLMDVQMPRMDGIETAAAIREGERGTGRHIPIIALTAHAMARDRERCLLAGMDGYLIKPIHPAGLLEAIERLSMVQDDAPPVAAADVAPPAVIHRAALLERVDGDPELLREIVELFARESGKHLATVRAALDAGDSAALGYGAHTLTGMFRNLCAEAAHEVASRLQELDADADGAREVYRQLEQEVERLKAALLEMSEEAPV